MTDYALLDVPPVDSVDDSEWGWAYEGVARLARRANEARFGLASGLTAAMVWSNRMDQADAVKLLTVAVTEPGNPDAVIGRIWVDLPTDANLTLAESECKVAPEWEGSSVGDDLLARGEAFSAEHQRQVLVTYAEFGSKENVSPFIVAGQGGNAPQTAPSIVRALQRGYELALVARFSVMSLPMAESQHAALWAEAKARGEGSGLYRLHTWVGPVPERWRRDFAAVNARFVTLEPAGSVLGLEDEVWDEQRVARHDALAEAIGRLMITTAVEHIASGQLVGYTTIAVDSSSQERAEQDNTIVLPGHQGHRLGLWAKLANLDELARRYPRLTQVRTWNAEENAFMLNINVQMGFKPVGGEAVMRKTLIDQDQLREM